MIQKIPSSMFEGSSPCICRVLHDFGLKPINLVSFGSSSCRGVASSQCAERPRMLPTGRAWECCRKHCAGPGAPHSAPDSHQWLDPQKAVGIQLSSSSGRKIQRVNARRSRSEGNTSCQSLEKKTTWAELAEVLPIAGWLRCWAKVTVYLSSYLSIHRDIICICIYLNT